MTLRPIRVCLILHSTRSDNFGVGALTIAEVAILRDISKRLGREIEITALDWADPRAPYVRGPDITVQDLRGRSIVDPRGYFAQARRADLVLDIGAGDSFADIYGGKRLSRMFALKYLTHLAGTPLVIAPQTVGPFTRGTSSALARRSMQRAAILATRDSLSTEAARSMGVTRDIIEASDVALRLPYDPPTPRSSGPVRVGLNVSGLLMGGGYTGKNEFGLKSDYPGLMRTLIRWFLDHPDGCEVHLVPHVFAPQGQPPNGEDDAAANDALAKEFPGVILAPRFTDPSEAKSYIAGLDFFAGARMHACIAAFSSGVPVVPMAYSRKFEGLFGTLGYTWTVDCTSEAPKDLLAKLQTGYTQRAELAEEAAGAYALGRQKLGIYELALETEIAKVG